MLAELDNEAEFLRVLASEARNRPQLLTRAVEQLVSDSFEAFAGWLAEQVDPPLPRERATALATIGLGSLYSTRLLKSVLGVAVDVDDAQLVDTWVRMLSGALAAEGAQR